MNTHTDQTAAAPLSLSMAVALVIGNMIGSGIFLLPAAMSAFGGVSLLGWLFTVAGAMLLALTFAWLARCRPAAGGIYAYTRMAFGDFAGFLVAWSYWIAVWIANGAIAVALVSYLSVFIPAIAESRLLGAASTIAVLWIFTFVNLRGLREAGLVQLVMTILKILPLIALTLWGLWYIEPRHFVPFNPTGQGLMPAAAGAAALALWSMIGLESASIAAAKVENPKRNVARATLLGTGAAALITAVACTVVMGVVPPELLRSSAAPFADAARLLWGDWGAVLLALTAVISCMGALNGWILLQGQLPQVMAADGLFPQFAGRENQRGAPAAALILGTVLTSAVVLLNYSRSMAGLFGFLALLGTLATLIPYLFCAMAGLRVLQADSPVPLKPWRAALLLLAALYALWTIAGAGQEVVYWGFLLLLTGLPVYVWLRRDQQQAVEPPH